MVSCHYWIFNVFIWLFFVFFFLSFLLASCEERREKKIKKGSLISVLLIDIFLIILIFLQDLFIIIIIIFLTHLSLLNLVFFKFCNLKKRQHLWLWHLCLYIIFLNNLFYVILSSFFLAPWSQKKKKYSRTCTRFLHW